MPPTGRGRRAVYAGALAVALQYPRPCHCQSSEWKWERPDLVPGSRADAIGKNAREHAVEDINKVRLYADRVSRMPRHPSRDRGDRAELDRGDAAAVRRAVRRATTRDDTRGADDARERSGSTPTLSLDALKKL